MFVDWHEEDSYMVGRKIHRWMALPLTCDFIFNNRRKVKMLIKKEINPWWNTLSNKEKIIIYFKYYFHLFTTGTLNDCNKWWKSLNSKEKNMIFNNCYEEK